MISLSPLSHPLVTDPWRVVGEMATGVLAAGVSSDQMGCVWFWRGSSCTQRGDREVGVKEGEDVDFCAFLYFSIFLFCPPLGECEEAHEG